MPSKKTLSKSMGATAMGEIVVGIASVNVSVVDPVDKDNNEPHASTIHSPFNLRGSIPSRFTIEKGMM